MERKGRERTVERDRLKRKETKWKEISMKGVKEVKVG